jgi:hypothetical protein
MRKIDRNRKIAQMERRVLKKANRIHDREAVKAESEIAARVYALPGGDGQALASVTFELLNVLALECRDSTFMPGRRTLIMATLKEN